jgi:hypothetical protein
VADHFDRRDDVVDRAIDALRDLPALDRAAVSKIVATAARARELDVEPHVDDLLPPRRGNGSRIAAMATIAAAAALVGYLVGGSRAEPVAATPVVASAPSSSEQAPVLNVDAPAPETMVVPKQFVFDSRGAKRVLLVGDFNGWGERALPLAREKGSSLWAVTVPLTPGRHVYAFLVDSTWTVDPRAPTTRDPDFGVSGSVVIVGKP